MLARWIVSRRARVLGSRLMTHPRQGRPQRPRRPRPRPRCTSTACCPRWAPLVVLGAAVVVGGAGRLPAGRQPRRRPWCSPWCSTWSASTPSRGSSRGPAGPPTGSSPRWSPRPSSLALVPLMSRGLDGGRLRRPSASTSTSSPIACAASSARAAAPTTRSSAPSMVTALATAHLGADRPARRRSTWSSTAAARLAQGDHVLRRRHDRHPVDRRRPVRLRAVRADRSAPGVPHAASPARSRCRC